MLTKLGRLAASFPFPPSSNNYNVATLPSVNTSDIEYATFPFKDPTGTEHYYKPGAAYNQPTNYISGALTATSSGVALGSGTTAPTEDDYTLENQVTGLSATITKTLQLNTETFEYSNVLTIVITNPSATDVVINEVGYFTTSGTNTTRGSSVGSNSNAKSFMIDRTILDEPLTVPANDSSVLQYVFKFPNQLT